MPVLLTTFGLLLVFALFSLAQWKNVESFLLTDQLASRRFSYFNTYAEDDISERSKTMYRNDPLHKGKPPIEETEDDEETGYEKPNSLDDSEEDKTQNAKRSTMLNISPLLCEDTPTFEGKGKSCFVLFKSLLEVLYEGEQFFDSLKGDIPDLEERFITACIESAKERRKDGKSLHSSSQLLILDLSEDPKLEMARFGMMRGGRKKGKETPPPASGVDHYMLHEFITINKNPQLMSIWLAPHPLLLAAFGDEKVVEEIMLARYEMFKELERERAESRMADQQKTSLSDLKKTELKRRFGSLLISGVSADHIDFGVSHTTPKKPPATAST